MTKNDGISEVSALLVFEGLIRNRGVSKEEVEAYVLNQNKTQVLLQSKHHRQYNYTPEESPPVFVEVFRHGDLTRRQALTTNLLRLVLYCSTDASRHILSRAFRPEIAWRVCGNSDLSLSVGRRRLSRVSSDTRYGIITVRWACSINTIGDRYEDPPPERGELLRVVGPQSKLDGYLEKIRSLDEAKENNQDDYHVQLEAVGSEVAVR